MARINLLPWREARRKQQQNEFFSLLGIAALATLVIWYGFHFFYSEKIDYQKNTRNQFLEQQISRLDERIKEIEALEREKERLLARMRAIEQLQTNRPLIVRLFDEMVRSLPEGVSLTSVKQEGANITINGAAQSNARVSSFMRNLESSDWLQNPKLDIIQAETAEGLRVSNFTLRFDQVIPKADGEEGEA